jgi:hypothetical protein
MYRSVVATEFSVTFFLSAAAANTQIFFLLGKAGEVFGSFL